MQKTMKKTFLASILAAAATASFSTTQAADTVTTTATGTVTTTDTVAKSDASYLQHIESKYLSVAGSHDNLASIASGLRSGGTITLQDSTLQGGTTTTGTTGTSGGTSSTSFESPTKPMGYGNITHTLDYASRELAAAGITSPTADQLKAALVGGTVVNSAGQSTTLQGVLQLRSQGMGWGQIAHTLKISPSPYSKYGVAGKSGLESTSSTTIAKHSGITTAGSSNQGVLSNSAKSVKSGIVSASGGTTVSHGNSNSHSGIVTAGGSGSSFSAASAHSQNSITLASGNASNGSITSANASSGHGNAYGKGKD